MVTVFFNGTGEYLMNILPQSRTMDTNYFAGRMIGGLECIGYPDERNPHQKKMTLHFDNPPIHNTRTVTGQLEQFRFKRMERPPYGPGFAPRNFFPFRETKEQLKKGILQRRKSFYRRFLNL
jgi:hypothetical protein